MSRVLLTELDRDDTFVGPDDALYQVTTPAREHPRGWVEAWGLSMARDVGVFVFICPVHVEQVDR